jgi:hypothetical protein
MIFIQRKTWHFFFPSLEISSFSLLAQIMIAEEKGIGIQEYRNGKTPIFFDILSY